jgi:hypothetical protein
MGMPVYSDLAQEILLEEVKEENKSANNVEKIVVEQKENQENQEIKENQ